MAAEARRALVLGATGLVGRCVLEDLLADPVWTSVRALVRRPLDLAHPRLDARVIDFEHLRPGDFADITDVASCLGTTRRQAGSAAGFRRVDHDYVIETARLAREAGATRLALVSSLGADAGSSLLYSRTKGEVEAALEAQGWPTLHVLRPSVLLGDRAQTRPGEAAGAWLLQATSWALVGPLRAVRPIEARVVARALVRWLHTSEAGVQVHLSDAIAAHGV